MKVSVLCYLLVEKLDISHALLPYTHPIVYPKCIGSGIQNTIKSNKLSSVMIVCKHGFHDGVGTHVTN